MQVSKAEKKHILYSTLSFAYTSKRSIGFRESEIMMHSHIQQMSHTNPYVLQIHCFAGRNQRITELLRLGKISKVLESNYSLFILYMYLLICNHYGTELHLLRLSLLKHFVPNIGHTQIRRGWGKMKDFFMSIRNHAMFSQQRNNNKNKQTYKTKTPKHNNNNNKNNWEENAFLLLLSAKTGNLEFFDEENFCIHFHIFFSLLITFKLLNFS